MTLRPISLLEYMDTLDNYREDVDMGTEMETEKDNFAVGILKIIVLGIVIGVTGYWASFVTQGAQRANINEAIINQISKNIETFRLETRTDMAHILHKLDAIQDKGLAKP